MTPFRHVLTFTLAALILWMGLGVVLAQAPREHTIAVTVGAGSPCSLTTDLEPPDYRLRVRPQDTIVLTLAGTVPASCGVGTGDRLALADFLMSGKPVAAPVVLVPGERRAYRVNPGRQGLYKFSITLGKIVLDPELEIEP
jgi:hypothetical protein